MRRVFYSHDHIVERDIDAEIEARLRHTRLNDPVTTTQVPAQKESTAPYKELDTLISIDAAAHEDLLRAITFSAGDVDLVAASSKPSFFRLSTCTERLEARISNSMVREDSLDHDDRALLYSGRQTYPAEPIKRTLSDTQLRHSQPQIQTQHTRMLTIVSKPRIPPAQSAMTHHHRQPFQPLVQKVRQDNKNDQGVSFHFYGGSPISHIRPSMPVPPPPSSSSVSMLTPPALSHALEAKHVTLSSQLSDIEKLVDDMERCNAAASFSTLAKAVVRELELLKGSCKQIRTNGASLILSEVGRPSTETVGALRRLVARAAALQKRIEVLMVDVKKRIV